MFLKLLTGQVTALTSTSLKTSGLLLRIRLPQNCGELERFMVEEWNAIPDDVLRNLVKEM